MKNGYDGATIDKRKDLNSTVLCPKIASVTNLVSMNFKWFRPLASNRSKNHVHSKQTVNYDEC